MKMKRSLTPLALLLLALALAFGPALRAIAVETAEPQPAPATPPAPPAPEKKPDETPPAASPAKPAEEEPVASPAAVAEKAEQAADQIAQEAEEPAGKIAEKTQEESTKADRKLRRLDRKIRRHGVEVDGISVRRHGDEAPPFGDHTVAAGNKASEAVSVFGDTVVDGEVSADAVSVFGSTTVNGTVGADAVSVFGTTTVNGTVKREVVAVFGDIVLGPKAVVEGNMTVVFGRVERAAGAQVHGHTQAVFGHTLGKGFGFDWLHAYLTKCVFWGRPLWFGEHLGWAWLVAAGFLLFYTLIALLFPRGIERCVETVEERPGGTVLAAFLTLVLTPFLIVLLCVTVVGIAVVPFLILALVVGHFFGKAVVHAWLGRRLARLFGLALPAPALAVIFGGVFITLLYLVPVLGFLLYKLFGVLGLGIVVYRLLLSMQREKPALAAAAAPGVPPVMGEGAAPVAAEAPPRPVITADTMPRAGFWIRVAAAALDAVMIGIACGFLSSIWHGFGNAFLFWYVVYCAAMWATKGTTIGGVICGLKIVRLDDRPLDWGVAIIRALSGFLSLFVAGLGFIWVAFDNDKQSWHDKIAGTTIVRVPKGTSLL